MKNKISIRDNIFDLFMVLALEEGYLKNIFLGSPNDRAQSIRNNIKLRGYTIPDLFSMLTHFFILYDKIEMPINTIHLWLMTDDLAPMIEATPSIPDLHIGRLQDSPLHVYSISDERASNLKPFIINACKNDNQGDFFSRYAEETAGSVENLYSYMFDIYCNKARLNEIDRIESDTREMYRRIDHKSYCLSPETECIYNAYKSVDTYLGDLLTIQHLAREGNRDFYSPSFSNYNSSVNTEDAYCILKTQISMIMEEQPAFESLTDLLQFRNKKRSDIKILRDEVASLEELIEQGARENAIEKAIDDVRKANQSLIKGSPAKTIAKIATYSSVPLSIAEWYFFKTSYSLSIGVVGSMAQLIVDSTDHKSDWLFVAR